MDFFKCGQCESSYQTSGVLRRHIRIKHDKTEKSRRIDQSHKPIPCSLCEYRTNTEGALLVHMDKHDDIEYMCVDCNYSHTNMIRFQNHKDKKHPNE